MRTEKYCAVTRGSNGDYCGDIALDDVFRVWLVKSLSLSFQYAFRGRRQLPGL